MSLTLKVIEIDKLEIGNTILLGRRIYHVVDIVEKDSFGYRLKLQNLKVRDLENRQSITQKNSNS